MKTGPEWIDLLKARNAEPILLEPREHLDACIIGITRTPETEPSIIDHWDRLKKAPRPALAVYDVDLCVEALARMLEGDRPAAEEWFAAHLTGPWLGPSTPCFRYVQAAIVAA